MASDWISEWKPPAPEMPQLDPETLAAVRALQDGEVQDSTRHLFKTFEPQLHAYFKRHRCEDDDADDLTQNVLIQMVDKIGTLREASSFHFWLFRIARHYLSNFRRAWARENEWNEDWEGKARSDGEPALFWTRGVFEPNPETKATVEETVDHRRLVLRKLLRTTRLAGRTRQALLLRLRGLSHEEIARQLGVSVGTVWSQLSRAGAALTKNLSDVDLSDVELDQDDGLADLDPELLTLRGETQAADPAYFHSATFECGSTEVEIDEERDHVPLDALMAKALRDSREEEEEDPYRPAERVAKPTVERAFDSPDAIADVFHQERMRGRRRQWKTRMVAPTRALRLALPKLPRDRLGYPLILLGEAAARCNGAGGGDAEVDLALQAKLTCAGALLARGRRFPVARQAERLVREAIVLIARGERDAIHNRVEESRGLLRPYLGRV